MKLPLTLNDIDFMSILKKLDGNATWWDLPGSAEGTLHLYTNGEETGYRITSEKP